MKRIGIVLLGLICLTLFGVGFNVNAEEATAPVVSVDLDDDGSGAPVLNWKIEFGIGSFPDVPTVSGPSSATSTYVYELTDPDGNVASTYSVTLSTGADGSHSVTAEGYDAPVEKDNGYEGFMCEPMNAATIKRKLALSQDENTKTGTFKIIQTSPVEKDENSETVTAYKVDLASAGGPDDVGFSVDDPQYLLKGESVSAEATSDKVEKHSAKADGNEKVYTYHNWSAAGGVTVTAGVRSDSEITITKTAADETGTVTANYGNVSMNISGLTPNTEIKPGVSSGDLPVAVTAEPEGDAYTRADVAKVIVSDAGTEIELSRDKGEWDWGNNKFSFTVPKDKAKKDDAAKLIIKMNDGNSFTCQFRIAGKESPPAVDHIVKLGKVGNGRVTATNLRTKQSSSTAVRGDTTDVIFLEAEPADGFTFEKWTAVKDGGKAVNINHYTRPEGAWFDIEDDNVNVTAHFKKNATPGHSVTVSSDGHGIGTATPSVANPGTKVTIKAYAEDGYKFKEWITTDKTILDNPNRATTTFTMPDHDVNVKALFKSIPKKSIKDAKVELSRSSFIYNGRIQKPIIKKIGGRLLTNGMDYSVKWSNKSSCNAGRYKLTITGEGDYTGKITATYTIKKASNTLKVSAKKKDHTVKLSELKKKSRTLKGSQLYVFTQKKRIKGDLKYSLSSVRNNGKTVKKGFAVNRKSGKLTIKKGVAKGVYNVKVKVSAEGNKNYDKATKSINFTVNVK